MAFVHAVTNVVLEVVPDVKLKTLFLARLQALMGRLRGVMCRPSTEEST